MSQDTDITLVVVSKVKKLVKDTHGLRTSVEAIEALSTMVLEACAEAAVNAKADGRKTIQARDFEPLDEPETPDVVEAIAAAEEAEEDTSDDSASDLSSFGL